jgi:phage head maturation protease
MPPDELLTRELGGELMVRSEPDRVIEARLLRWGEVADTPQGRERFIRGAFRGIDPGSIALEAIGGHGEIGARLAGRGIELEERDDGPYAAFRVSRTVAGDELLELARDGVYRSVSVVFAPVDGGTRIARAGVLERTRASLARVGIVERGAFPSAQVLAVRSADMPATETPTPPDPPEPTPDPPAPSAMPPGTGVATLSRSADGGHGLEELRTEMLGRMIALEARPGGAGASPLARWSTFDAYAAAVYAEPLLARALVDQLTTDNPGVMPPSWVTDIAGILARPRPAIAALGGPRSLGDSGMELDWPYLDPALDLDTVVAVQAAEKTDIASVKVKILKGTSPIVTYAGGSDVSYQLIRRSRPAYREAYLRILAICYARATEAAFETALEAGAAGSAVLAADADANAVRAFLFGASDAVEEATGSPATVDLVSSAEFARLGGLRDLAPAPYGTSNISGTADAASLRISISGLPIIKAPFLTGNTHLVTNGEAAGFHEDGPFPISAEDVAKLGQNVAIWGMGATALTVPAGIVKSTLVVGATASRGGSKG